MWVEITRALDDHAYMSGVERTAERVAATGEVFTPSALVVEMLRSQPVGTFGPGRTVLDPACGDGQFLLAVKLVKMLVHGMDEAAALAEIYGVDVMRDNVDLCRQRLGGGTIVMGDTLHPETRLEGQTEAEHRVMRELFEGEA